jgi:predicted nuclease of predicted toxin-antitoxin system
VQSAKLDENVPVEAAELVRAAGWNCDTVHDEGLAGEEDPQIAAVCQAERRVLFTLDLDFADIGPMRRKITSASWCFDRLNQVDGRCSI